MYPYPGKFSRARSLGTAFSSQLKNSDYQSGRHFVLNIRSSVAMGKSLFTFFCLIWSSVSHEANKIKPLNFERAQQFLLSLKI